MRRGGNGGGVDGRFGGSMASGLRLWQMQILRLSTRACSELILMLLVLTQDSLIHLKGQGGGSCGQGCHHDGERLHPWYRGSSPSTPKQIESPVQRSVDGNPGRRSMVNALPAARRPGGV